ncbi:MAG: peptidoglycan editing factor PgeF [Burkholderiales bacterium]
MHNINQGFTLREKYGLKYLTIPSFEEAGGVVCAFSTRVGGVSPAPYNTLNFSKKREQSPENFLENLKRFGKAAGFDHNKAVSINYAHSALLYKATHTDSGCGITRDCVPEVCDGLYTDETQLPLISFHADCVPLFFYDPVKRCAAVCHAGWRGVVAHMAANAVKALISLGSNAGDILAAVGPCIGPERYEVGQDVSGLFLREFGKDTVETRGGRTHLHLARSCVIDMLNAGIRAGNITESGLCTYDGEELFFSHRRDNGRTGSMAAVIMLTDA